MTRSFLVRELKAVTSAIRMAKVLLLASSGVWHAAAQVRRCVNIPASAIATPPNSAACHQTFELSALPHSLAANSGSKTTP